jgi:transposase
VELPRTRHGLGPTDWGPARSGKCARCLKKKAVSSYRPTGRLDPAPADLAYGSLALAALEYQARRGEIILLYEDETILWRFALPRAGWWHKAQRVRLPTRPLSQSQIKRAERLKRQVWVQHRSWSRITSGVLLSVIGAVQYGTSRVIYKIVPHFDAQELRQYLHQVMAIFRKTEKEVVMVVDRSGIHRAHKLDATLDHYEGKFRFHFLPAHCGHHLNPIEGFWRVMKDTIGAGRCFGDLPQLYKRTRQVLMAHQERPIYEFHW